ncbi:MAG: hypothetical protein NTX13_19480 [Acidobacteria bacterium]|jgi:hypothetical protein|nr:hypothetical protein [Acidobacteriota bacterium]
MADKRPLRFDCAKAFDFERGYRAIAADCSLPPAEVRARIASTDLVVRLETGLIEPGDFVAQVSDLVNFPGNCADFCAHSTAISLPETLFPESLLTSMKG